jgi:flagellar P-ring protein precursor FlgI
MTLALWKAWNVRSERERKVKPMNRLLGTLLGLALLAAAAPGVYAYSRIKDITDIEGVRENQLVGYGLVVGLNGTGDSLRNAPGTQQSLQAMLERLGINTRGTNISSGNVAAVLVTANLPPFATQGTRIDVTVSAIGDAKNLQGGTLLATPLLGADGHVYAVSQGQIAINGFSAQGQAASVTKGVPTAGRIAAGAIVEREIAFDLSAMRSLRLSLRNPDFTTAKRVTDAINTFLGSRVATTDDPATVRLSIPASASGNIVALLTDIEQLRVQPDQPAKVLVDEASGIIVMGADVRISAVAIAQGNLTIRVTELPDVSQPDPFSGGETTIVPSTEIDVNEQSDRKLAVLKSGVSLQQLVNGLNALGVSPRDMIAILQAIKAAGALQAEIEVM